MADISESVSGNKRQPKTKREPVEWSRTTENGENLLRESEKETYAEQETHDEARDLNRARDLCCERDTPV